MGQERWGGEPNQSRPVGALPPLRACRRLKGKKRVRSVCTGPANENFPGREMDRFGGSGPSPLRTLISYSKPEYEARQHTRRVGVSGPDTGFPWAEPAGATAAAALKRISAEPRWGWGGWVPGCGPGRGCGFRKEGVGATSDDRRGTSSGLPPHGALWGRRGSSVGGGSKVSLFTGRPVRGHAGRLVQA